jgi:hypothetical protein
MITAILRRPKPYGLFELDADDVVIYSRHEGERDCSEGNDNVNGRNFFSEVAPFSNSEELRIAVKAFRESGAPAKRIDFTCRYDNEAERVRVLLARLCDQSDLRRTKSTLVHIQKV